MLQIPHVPSIPKVSGFRFKGVVEHQTRQALAAEIKETIDALIKSTYIPGYIAGLRRYANIIDPGKIRPWQLLPYKSNGPNDRLGDTKIACVYARLSWVIQMFWNLCLDGADNAVAIRGHLSDLRTWAAAGIDNCKILGSPHDGYWLVGVTEE